MPAPAGIFYWSVFLGLSVATQDVSVILAWWSIKQVNGDDLHLRGRNRQGRRGGRYFRCKGATL